MVAIVEIRLFGSNKDPLDAVAAPERGDDAG